jgi:hypothetical protein
MNCHPDRSAAEWSDLLFGCTRHRMHMEATPFAFVIESGDGPAGLAAGPPKGMKNTFCPATALYGSVALPFVIPSEAEGSAVLLARPGQIEVEVPHLQRWDNVGESKPGTGLGCRLAVKLLDHPPVHWFHDLARGEVIGSG